MNPAATRQRYVQHVLRRYATTPTVLGHIRRADRELAGQFYDRGVPSYAIEYAFVLGAARRVLNNAFSAPMPPVRSLAYFVPLLKEVLERPPGPRDIALLQQRLADHLGR